MSWLEQLEGELRTRGLPHRDRRRIVAELADHLACEPASEARLGEPHALAATFADELATTRTRTAAFRAFAALSAAAAVLAVSQVAIGSAHGFPGYDRGLSIALFIPAALGMLIAPQVALVAGTLAALRALRRRRSAALPAAEVQLIARRTRVALAAGAVTMAGLELYVIDFARRLPAWWLILVAGTAWAAAIGIAAAWAATGRSAAIVCSRPGPAGDVFDDVPLLDRMDMRAHPWRLGLLGSLAVTALMTLVTGHAEGSLVEGLERGIPEGLAAAAGFVLLGGAVGLRPARDAGAPPPAAGP